MTMTTAAANAVPTRAHLFAVRLRLEPLAKLLDAFGVTGSRLVTKQLLGLGDVGPGLRHVTGLVGKPLVIHANRDNLTDTPPNGGSGRRIACGILAR